MRCMQVERGSHCHPSTVQAWAWEQTININFTRQPSVWQMVFSRPWMSYNAMGRTGPVEWRKCHLTPCGSRELSIRQPIFSPEMFGRPPTDDPQGIEHPKQAHVRSYGLVLPFPFLFFQHIFLVTTSDSCKCCRQGRVYNGAV